MIPTQPNDPPLYRHGSFADSGTPPAAATTGKHDSLCAVDLSDIHTENVEPDRRADAAAKDRGRPIHHALAG
jgi:hypothetical protein